MNPTKQQTEIRDKTNFIKGTTHYNRRKHDGKYEVLAQLKAPAREALGLSIGGEVVLDVCANRNDALDSVRFFRGHKQ